MNVLPIDFVALVSVIMGISIVLIPVAGLTARYALKPIVEALGRYIEGKGSDEAAKITERRLALLEQQIDEMQGALNRLVEVSEFHASLRGAGRPSALPRGADDAGQSPDASGPGPDATHSPDDGRSPDDSGRSPDAAGESPEADGPAP